MTQTHEEPTPDERVIKLIVAYDGSAFHGWQRQKDQRTVQAELEAALSRIAGHAVAARASSRTDAGVHARGLLVSFRSQSQHPCHAFHLGGNALLPKDVRVMSAEDAPAGFDARRASLGKTYRYQIWNAKSADPLLRHQTWHVKRPLDLEAIQASLPDLLGPQDWSSFRAAGCDAKTTDREMWAARWTRGDDGSHHIFEVTGNAFLRNMVRIMVGSLVGIGLGRRPPGDLRRQLDACSRAEAGDTTPGHGLVLHQVFVTTRELFEHLGRPVTTYKTQIWPDS